MRRILASALLILMVFQLTAKLQVLVVWKINQDYISQILCENKAKPEIQCDGKCYLKKQLRKTEAPAPAASFPTQVLKIFEVSTVVPPASTELVCVFLTQSTSFTNRQRFAFYNTPALSIPTPPPDICVQS